MRLGLARARSRAERAVTFPAGDLTLAARSPEYYNDHVTAGIPPEALRLKQRLEARFGARLRWARVFGSYARGEATEDSDLDVAAVIDGLTRAEKIEAIGDAAELSWIGAVKLSPLLFESQDYALLREREARLARDIESEGIEL